MVLGGHGWCLQEVEARRGQVSRVWGSGGGTWLVPVTGRGKKWADQQGMGGVERVAWLVPCACRRQRQSEGRSVRYRWRGVG